MGLYDASKSPPESVIYISYWPFDSSGLFSGTPTGAHLAVPHAGPPGPNEIDIGPFVVIVGRTDT